MEKVSVVIPCYNSERTIYKTIEAVLVNKPHEVIVVDDCSTDVSVDAARKLLVRVVTNFVNRGVATARNQGANLATGDLLLFVDSDIIIPPDAIERAIKSLTDDVDAVIGMPVFSDRYINIFSKHFNWRIHHNYLHLPEIVPFTYGSFTLMRKEKFIKLGGYNTALKGAINEDNEFGLRNNLRVKLDKSIQIFHYKDIGLFDLLRNDFHRSAGRMRLYLKYGKGLSTFVSTPISQVVSIPLAWLTFLNPLFFIGFLLCYRKYLWFLVKKGYWKEALQIIPILFIDMLVVTFGVLRGLRKP